MLRKIAKMTNRHLTGGVARLLFSVVFLSFILWKVGAENTLSRMSSLQFDKLPVVVVLLLLTISLHTKRWIWMLQSMGYCWGFRDAFREAWIGYFFNQLLPSSVGGDGVRGLRLYRAGIPAGVAARSVVAERVFGLMACVLLAIISVPILLWQAPNAPVTKGVCLVVILSMLGMLFVLRPNRIILKFLPSRIEKEVVALSKLINKQSFCKMLSISVAMQLTIAGSIGVLGLGLGIEKNPLIIAMLFQPVTLMTLLPVSFAGWGIREGALVAILGVVGVPSIEALPLSLTFGGILLFISLPGWIFYATVKLVVPCHTLNASPKL